MAASSRRSRAAAASAEERTCEVCGRGGALKVVERDGRSKRPTYSFCQWADPDDPRRGDPCPSLPPEDAAELAVLDRVASVGLSRCVRVTFVFRPADGVVEALHRGVVADLVERVLVELPGGDDDGPVELTGAGRRRLVDLAGHEERAAAVWRRQHRSSRFRLTG